MREKRAKKRLVLGLGILAYYLLFGEGRTRGR